MLMSCERRDDGDGTNGACEFQQPSPRPGSRSNTSTSWSLREQGRGLRRSDTHATSKTPKEMIMTKCIRILLVAALSVTVANPALARCGSGHAKTSHAAVAAKKPVIAGLRMKPTAQATTADVLPTGLSTDPLGG